jgi:hypothetical protein
LGVRSSPAGAEGHTANGITQQPRGLLLSLIGEAKT